MRRLAMTLLAFAVLSAGLDAAAQRRKTEEPTDKDSSPSATDGTRLLSGQDRQVLEWAQECASRLAKTMEQWIADNKITKEKLFSFLYYPIPDTDPPKFHSDMDHLSDRDFVPIQEYYLAKSKAIVFVVTVDRNGYLPTHNKKYSQPLTGHLSVDLVSNRTKRIFNDKTGINAARNTQPYLLQKYKRDTGEFMNDLSVPIYIDGGHWGGVRFGYVSTE
jgi:methyl-accepting chemotaxis protein